MTQGKLEPENTIEDVKVRIQKSYKNANVGTVTQAVLKEGPRAFKIATLMEIINPKTESFHHYSLKIDHIDRTKAGWFHKPEKSVRLEDTDQKEIEKLHTFLSAAYVQNMDGDAGDLRIISALDYQKLEKIIEAIPNFADSDKLNLVGSLLSEIDSDSSSVHDFVAALETSNIENLKSIAAASKLIEYTAALDKLKLLVQTDGTSEKEFQKHLESNSWMFGSEYSELLPRKTWTRDDRLDYMLRKTVDEYLEIVEIKTAFSEPLFLHDSSHDSYYPSSKLSPVLGQVARYIEEVERNRDSIIAVDGSDPLKIRARIIIGRDGNDHHQKALRNFNAHLHRIEILTYEQLIKIAERVLEVFGLSSNKKEIEEIPF